MASMSGISVKVSADFGYIEPQLRALAAFFDADNALDRGIELSAFKALCEMQAIGDAVKRELGIVNDHTMQLTVKMERA